jgi:squalene synthase HpnC
MTHPDPQVRAAYAECRRIARRHYENFPTASLFVPGDKRDALAAVYAFARYADDLADEPGVEGRLEKLAAWRAELEDCCAGNARRPVFVALHDAINTFRLSPEHFQNLLRAFEQDVLVNRRPDFQSVLSYCANSANPVGRLVLELFNHRDPELIALSDNICTALQLTNFWQDVAVDFERDRVYLPLDDLQRFGLTLEDLAKFMPPRGNAPDERWGQLMAFEIARTREFFEQGKALPEKVSRELRLQLRLTWLGGMAILDRIESAGYDVFRRRPSLGRWNFLKLYFRARRNRLGPEGETRKSTPDIANHR